MAVNRKQTHRGVRWVSSLIRSRYTESYIKRNYGSVNEASRHVVANLASEGKRVNITNVLSAVRVKRGAAGGKTKEQVSIQAQLLKPTHYFDIQHLYCNQFIPREDNRIFFNSTLFSKGLPELQGGNIVDYNLYFRKFVSFCDKQRKNTEDTSMYHKEWFVVCTPATTSLFKKRYTSEIYSCDEEGNRVDYGFDADTFESDLDNITGLKTSATTEKKQVTSSVVPGTALSPSDQVRIQELKTEQSAHIAKALEELNSAYKQGLITAADYSIGYKKIFLDNK